MEGFIYSDTFSLLAVLVSIIAIVFLFLVFGRKQNHSKVHLYYISGLCAFIVIELATYICLNNDHSDEIVSYISFASTISSLFLSVVAIIYAIVSNNKGEAQYYKIDRTTDTMLETADNMRQTSDYLSHQIHNLVSEIEDLKHISMNTQREVILNRAFYSNTSEVNEEWKNGNAKLEFKSYLRTYILSGSCLGNLALLACIYSYKKQRGFDLNKIFGESGSYCYGYIMSATAVGLFHAYSENDLVKTDRVAPFVDEMEKKLVDFINVTIDKSCPVDKEALESLYNNIKTTFDVES